MAKHLWVFLSVILCVNLNYSYTHAQAAQTLAESGTISAEQIFIEYPLTIPDGSSIVMTMQVPANSELDAYLLLVDSAGNVVVENDQRSDTDLNPYIEYDNLMGGDYRAIATRYNIQDGDTNGDFTLDVTISPQSNDTPTFDVSDTALADAGYETQPATNTVADWTILAYYGGDTNLEEAIINDIEEFELGGGSDQQVQIAAFLDRSLSYYANPDTTKDWSGARVFHLQNATNPTFDARVDTPALFELDKNNAGIVDSGSGQSLAQFLVWGIRNYPAKHYIVAFASHGAAWNGLIVDEGEKPDKSTDKSIISLPQLKEAFRLAQQELLTRGQSRFDLVINDACLMSSLEYYSVMSEFADYSLASPEIVLSPALNMTILTESLRTNPDENIADPNGVAKALIDRYMADVAENKSSDVAYMASALTDLQLIPALDASLADFATLVNANPQAYATVLGQARTNVYTYSAYSKQNKNIDLGDFMQHIISNSNDSALINAAQAIKKSLEKVVVYGNAQSLVQPYTTYLNIYFPGNRKSFDNQYYTQSPLVEWTKLLNNYFNQLTAQVWTSGAVLNFHPPIAPKITIANQYPAVGQTIDSNSGVSLDVEIEGRKLSRGTLVVDQMQDVTDENGQTRSQSVRLVSQPVLEKITTEVGEQFVNQWSSGVSKKAVRWDAFLTQVADGSTQAFELLESASTLDSLSLKARYRTADNQPWADVTILFGEQTFESDTGAYMRQATSAVSILDGGGVASIRIPVGATVQTYRTVVTKNGLEYVPSTVYQWQVWGLKSYLMPATNGDYQVSFTLENFSGQQGRANATVTVNNDAFDLGYYGNLYVDDGFNQILPANWSTLVKEEQGYYSAYAYDNWDEWLEIYPIHPNTFAIETTTCTLTDQFALRNNAIIQSAIECSSLAFGESIIFEYRRRAGGDLYSAKLIASQRDYLVFAPSFVIDTATVDTLFNNLRLLDLTAYDEAATDKWLNYTVSYALETGTMPLPIEWLGGVFDTKYGIGVSAEADGVPVNIYLNMVTGFTNSTQALEYFNPTGVTSTGQRKYYGENYTWDVLLYDFVEDSKPYKSRNYAITTDLGNTYVFQFIVSDDGKSEQVFTDKLELILDGFSIPDPLRTYTNDTLGISLKYDRQWTYMTDNPDESYISTTSADNNQQIWVYYYPDSTDARAVADNFVADFSLNLTGRYTPATFQGRQGFYLDYLYTGGGDQTAGHAFASLDPATNMGLVLAFETTSFSLSQADMTTNFDTYIGNRFSFASQATPTTSVASSDVSIATVTEIFKEPLYTMEIPDYFRPPLKSTEDAYGNYAYDWFSPTVNTRISVSYISTAYIDSEQVYSLESTKAPQASGESQSITLDGRPAIMYRVENTDLNESGYAVTTFLPEAQYVMTVRVQGTPDYSAVADIYETIFNSIHFLADGVTYNPDDFSNGLSYPIDVDPLASQLYTFTPPQGWSDWQYLGNGQAFSSAPDSAINSNETIDIWSYTYYQRPTATLEEFATRFLYSSGAFTSSDTFTPVQIGGHDALAFDIYFEGAGGFKSSGVGLVMFLGNDIAQAFTVESAINIQYKTQLAYQCLADSIRFDGTSAEPCAWTPTRTQKVEGITLETPPNATDYTYDADNGWYASQDATTGEEFYVYFGAQLDTLSNSLTELLGTAGISPASEPTSVTTANGIEGLQFPLDYMYGDVDYQGQAIAINANGQTYIFSIEAPDAVDSAMIQRAFERLVASLVVPE